MPNSGTRLITAIIVAAIGIGLGVWLAIYSEADDAPGGVLVAIILMIGSVALGIRIARKRAR